MKAGVAASPLAILAAARIAQARRGRNRGKRRKKKRGGKTSSAQTSASGGVKFTPFTQDLPIPSVLDDVNPFDSPCLTEPDITNPDVSNQFTRPPKFYQIRVEPGAAEILPGVTTEGLFTYDGLYPGPTIRARLGEPAIVRFTNDIVCPLSTHLHGAHNPSGSDGFPSDFIFPVGFDPANFDHPSLQQALDDLDVELIDELDPDRGCFFQGQSMVKDYCFPNVLPVDNGVPDASEAPSTMWYHDHAMDISGENVYSGLAAFYLFFDPLEEELIDTNVLPQEEFDVPLVLQDRSFRRGGKELFFDPLEHNGFLGDVMVINGKAQPKFHVQRRKYRFRILNGANARFFLCELSSGQEFLRVGTDSWLLPYAVPQKRIFLSNAQRADVIIDFRDAPDVVFLNDVVRQEDGRGPKGKLFDPRIERPGTPLVKFIVEGNRVDNDATVTVGTPLRPHVPIRRDEIEETRRFVFERSGGAWVVNGELFDPCISNANPKLGSAERWILENKSGGWWHPIHIHLEAHQVQKIEGRTPPPEWASKVDTTTLGPNTVAEVFMKFRTFPGPFVFHCHNLEHEDMRMMGLFEVDGPDTEQTDESLDDES